MPETGRAGKFKQAMTRGGNKGGKGLGEEDFKLWKAFTRDIEPLEDTPPPEDPVFETAPPLKPAFPETRKKSAAPPPAVSQAPVPRQAPQLDGRTELRLKRGQMPIDARLDLHGCTQAQAHGLLQDFVMGAHGRGKRCLLVITGKGGRNGDGEGILKQRVPQWLALPPLRDVVLKVLQAAPQHGGSGAAYIYLRRDRTLG